MSIHDGEKPILLYDPFSGRSFFYDANTLQAVLNNLNDKRIVQTVSLYDFYEALGLNMELFNEKDICTMKQYGWNDTEGLHELTFKERHPDGCPCCGRPWEKGSE